MAGLFSEQLQPRATPLNALSAAFSARSLDVTKLVDHVWSFHCPQLFLFAVTHLIASDTWN